MRILVTGASGQLGSYLIKRLSEGRHETVAWSARTTGTRGNIELRPIDFTEAESVLEALADVDPDVIIHAAAISSAEDARRNLERCRVVNIGATRLLSEWASDHNRRLIYTSTDLVFNGEKGWYREEDPASPALVYGQTKHAAERFVLDVPRGLVARLSLLFGSSLCKRPGFFDLAVSALRAGTPQTFFMDEFRTPLDYATAAHVIVRLAELEVSGIVHVGGSERMSRFELMRRAASALHIDPSLIRSNQRAEVPLPEPRPADVSLDCSLLRQLSDDWEWPTVEAVVVAYAASPVSEMLR